MTKLKVGDLVRAKATGCKLPRWNFGIVVGFRKDTPMTVVDVVFINGARYSTWVKYVEKVSIWEIVRGKGLQ